MISRLHDLVFINAKKRPQSLAVVEAGPGGGKVTYAELADGIKKAARGLKDMGFRKGDRLGILSKNSISFIEAFFAASFAGGVAVPLNPALKPLEISRMVRHAGVSVLYTEKGALKKKRSTKAPSQAAAIIYTSGTTGNPLGVMLSHNNLIQNARSIVSYTGLASGDSILCVLPFCYIYGLSLVTSHFLAGGTVVLENRFMYPSVILDSLCKYRTTGFAGVSSHYSILLSNTDFKGRAFPALRYFMQAGDKMPENIAKDLCDCFPRKKIFLMYGLTEASPRLTYLDPDLVRSKPGSVGKAVPGTAVKIVDDRGRPCKAGIEGEIIARGRNIMMGYWKNRTETKNAVRKGWLFTGDLGYKDRGGDLFVVGRKKAFVKIGGRKVNPAKVADCILGHPLVNEAVVVCVPDRFTGSSLKAFIIPRQGSVLKIGEVYELCKRQLPSYCLPSKIVFVSSLPRNVLGKIDRERLVGL